VRWIWNLLKFAGRWVGPALLILAATLIVSKPLPLWDPSASVALIGAIITAIACFLIRGPKHHIRRSFFAAAAFAGFGFWGWTYCSDLYNFHEETISFRSHETTLAGSLFTPKRKKLFAVVVWVDGSGPLPRSTTLAKKFASHGIAVLVYDKRGVGESGGNYEGDRNASGDNLRLLADDASAAIDFVAAHPTYSNLPRGLIGISQAGWIIPLAANSNDKVQFIGIFSGPVCKVSEEGIFSEFTEDKNSLGHIPAFEKIRATVGDSYAWPAGWGEDIDSSETAATLSIPGYWIFGADDGVQPVDLSIARLKSLIDRGKNQFQYKVFEGVGHMALFPGQITAMANWIKKTISSEKNRNHSGLSAELARRAQ
jgi:pimeloyl-ACP methyl ester carboxylesterase